MQNEPLQFFLVDDDPDDTFIFRNALEDAAASVQLITAVNGRLALEQLSSSERLPDIIFLDLNMPVMDGKECLTSLRTDPRYKDIPVIMYTTSSRSKDIEEALNKGAICFITKPDNIKELVNILSVISRSVNGNLLKSLQSLSTTSTAYILC